MRNTVIWSFLSLIALSTGGLVTGCDSDEKLAKSALGESCNKTSDCDDGLRCLEGACYQTSIPSGGSSNQGGEGNGTAGTLVGPKPAVLGGEGESCGKRADCEDGLGCFSGRCTMDASGAGGEGTSGGPVLGARGETCTLTPDCAKGMVCLPAKGENYEGIGVGVCTPIDSGLEPTGKACGFECVEAADCCELPVAQHALLGASSCADLAVLVDAVPDCAVAAGKNGSVCLAYSVYCDGECTAKTWSCEAGRCSYAAKCTKAGEVIGGCPAFTRGGHAGPACDIKAGTCTGVPVAVAGCKEDADCDAGLAVADSSTADLCSEGECTCYAATGGCYRKCSETEDCLAGFTCNDDTALCVPLGSCTTDAQCITDRGDVRYTCVDGACQPPACEHDIDCNRFGLTDGNFSQVCNADKQCVVLGCSTNDECGAYAATANAGGIRSFCGDPVTTATTITPVSAITD